MVSSVTQVSITLLDGSEHTVYVRDFGQGHFSVSVNGEVQSSGRTREEAIANTVSAMNHNHPSAFDRAPEEHQQRILDYCRQHFLPGTPGNQKRYSSYYLKHVVERAIDEYVGNGELKGAMQQLEIMPTKDSAPYDINYDYVLQKYPRSDKQATVSGVIKRKPTLGPVQCDHCSRIWYGSFRRGGEGWLPEGYTLCLKCWSELDEYLYRHFRDRYNLSWSYMKPEDIPFIHEQGRKWIADTSLEPLRPKNIYRGGGVPKWIQIAIERGLVKTNCEDVYTITTRAEDDEPMNVEVNQDRSSLRRHRW